jgi:hypothetical protein
VVLRSTASRAWRRRRACDRHRGGANGINAALESDGSWTVVVLPTSIRPPQSNWPCVRRPSAGCSSRAMTMATPRVLVIEDDHVVTETLTVYLEQAGFAVRHAGWRQRACRSVSSRTLPSSSST